MEAIALLLAGSQGLLLSLVLIVSRYRRNDPNLFLGIILFICSIELLNGWGIRTGYQEGNPLFPFWSLGSYLALPPAIWYFLQSIINKRYSFKKAQFIWFLPAALEIITEISVFYFRKMTGSSFTLIRYNMWVLFTEYLPVLAMITGFILLSLRFSFRDQLSQPRYILFFVLFNLLTLLWAADSLFHLPVYSITEFILCTILFLLGYVIYFKPGFFDHMSPALQKKDKVGLFTHFQDDLEYRRLLSLFESEKIHLRQRLTLEDVANEMKLPERYISYLIREYGETNFNKFINLYRVNEFLSRVQNPQEANKTLLGIAQDSGFSSKSSFNHIFKSITGKSPSEYLHRD